MTNQKLIGSFYTPKIISDFLVQYITGKIDHKEKISVLEPSAGDGIFIKSIISNKILEKSITSISVVEREKNELIKITNSINNKKITAIHSDFLDYQKNNIQKFTIVIGNPPYIKKSLLTPSQIELCKEIHLNASLSKNEIKNIWTAFLVRSIEFTDESGIMAFVLPAEFLQVKYAEELRALLKSKFDRLEIFTFSELLFTETNAKGQDTCLLICEKKSQYKGVYYCNINKVSDLENNNFFLTQNISLKDYKWTHYHLFSEEIELIERIGNQCKKVNDFCTSKAGIVTAANDYFIINNQVVEKYSLQEFIKPIIQKGFFVNGSVVIGKKELNQLKKNSKPTYLLALDKYSVFGDNHEINEYLSLGKELEIDKRYKTSIRQKWYEVPNIGNPPEAFFFKRCNEYPKLIKNKANLLVTDSAYTISMNSNYNLEGLIYSFYNSLSLAFAELQGRFYGGGVLELTPNEFKSIPIPFTDINKKDFNAFVKVFKNKKSIKDICLLNDEMILKSIDKQISRDEINNIYAIREKLYLRRIKANIT